MGKNNKNPPSWAFEGVWSPSLPSAASNYSQVSRKAAAAQRPNLDAGKKQSVTICVT